MDDAAAVQLFCLSDRDFFDSPDRIPDEASRFALGSTESPPGWLRTRSGWWVALRPADVRTPEQGWKIHVAALPENAGEVLERVADICLRRRIAFKFLRSAAVLSVSVSKYWPRSSSGKFVTVYPADDEQLATLLDELVSALDGVRAPHVLGDLRLGGGPVHVRFGGFVDLRCPGPDGRPVPAVRDPEGRLVPDVRGAVFRPPAWAPRPACLKRHLDAGSATGLGDLPYQVLRSLRFSTAGGLYLAQDERTGRKVVLREARPNTGWDGADDAITRLRREYAVLERLQDLGTVPRTIELRPVWEHEFLVEEHIEGQTLMRAMIDRYPLVRVDAGIDRLDGYLAWVRTTMASVTAAVEQLHARGVCFRDLHPENIIVRPDGSVVLVDFEYAADVGRTDLPVVGAPGYTCGAGVDGAEADRYALRAIWRTMLLPVPELVALDRNKAATLEAAICELLPSVAADLAALAAPMRPPVVLGPGGPGSVSETSGATGEDQVQALFAAEDWGAIEQQLVAGIIRNATPERGDRLFPGDTALFDGQRSSVAHGAAGVLLALHTNGFPVPPEWVDWLVDAVRRSGPDSRQGLLDGVHGAAVALAALGQVEPAVEVVERGLTRPDPVVPRGLGLAEGTAGIALARWHLGTQIGDSRMLRAAEETARQLDPSARHVHPSAPSRGQRQGLLDGMAGVAALQLQLYRSTGDPERLAACRRALLRDVRACVQAADGSVVVQRDGRQLAYLGHGSSGIALVVAAYLSDRGSGCAAGPTDQRDADQQDTELVAFVEAVRRVAAIPFVREPGLLQGRAGLVAALACIGGTRRDVLGEQVRRFAWHLVHRDGALLTPGSRLRRFSMDLATGSAGVLLALRAVTVGPSAVLPLVPIPRQTPAELLVGAGSR